MKKGDIFMTKSSKEQIENDEKKVLSYLSKNANESINEIAKKCGFSRQKVWRIIKNLENNNTIWGYVAVIDKDKQGLEEYTVLIKRTTTPMSDEVIERIIERKLDEMASKFDVNILSSFYLNGIYDWMLCFTAENIKQAKKLCEALHIAFKGYVTEIQLLEKMFPAKKCGIINPEIEKLKDFFTGVDIEKGK
jgi:DNA-binding Lrp family transcriptional regulator